jgi:hypothetical protein
MAIEGLHEEIRESPSPICHRVEDLDRWLRESTVHHMPNGLGYADFRGSRIIIVDWSLASVDLTDWTVVRRSQDPRWSDNRWPIKVLWQNIKYRFYVLATHYLAVRGLPKAPPAANAQASAQATNYNAPNMSPTQNVIVHFNVAELLASAGARAPTEPAKPSQESAATAPAPEEQREPEPASSGVPSVKPSVACPAASEHTTGIVLPEHPSQHASAIRKMVRCMRKKDLRASRDRFLLAFEREFKCTDRDAILLYDAEVPEDVRIGSGKLGKSREAASAAGAQYLENWKSSRD